jgi:hypothetical protein
MNTKSTSICRAANYILAGRYFFLSLSHCQKNLGHKKNQIAAKSTLSSWKKEIIYNTILCSAELMRTDLFGNPTFSGLSKPWSVFLWFFAGSP